MASSNFQRFIGKVALVAGGSHGIGYAVAERLAREGAKVVLCSRKKENVEEATQKLISQGYEAKGVVCHISNRDQRKELFEAAHKLGGLDILYSNAGVNPSYDAGILDIPESAWDKIFDVNVKSTYLLSKEALPLLKKSSCGAYAVSKTAILSLTKMVSLQLAKHNITVNCVAPGLIDTRFSDVLVSDKEKTDKLISNIPLERKGKPEEVAALVAFLASEEAGYITGVLDCPESAWDKIFDVNVKSTYLLSKEALPLLKKSNCGAYTVSKTAILSLTKMVSLQLAKHNITVNCVAPGIIDTRFSDILVSDKEKTDKLMSIIPLERKGKPEEVAALVAFLASEEAGYITGENVFISGGIMSRL